MYAIQLFVRHRIADLLEMVERLVRLEPFPLSVDVRALKDDHGLG